MSLTSVETRNLIRKNLVMLCNEIGKNRLKTWFTNLQGILTVGSYTLRQNLTNLPGIFTVGSYTLRQYLTGFFLALPISQRCAPPR